MHIQAIKALEIPGTANCAYLANELSELPESLLSKEELEWAQSEVDAHQTKSFVFNRLSHRIAIYLLDKDKEAYLQLEAARKVGAEWVKVMEQYHNAQTYITSAKHLKDQLMAMAEGVMLASYKFIKFITDKKKTENCLCEVYIEHDDISIQEIRELEAVCDACCEARSLVNRPVCDLNAVDLAKHAKHLGEKTGMSVTIFDKEEIQKLGMGGLLGVNAGSVDPPTFTILEYKPEKAVNAQPIIFVGKGVVYDTGGLNIKTGNFMNDMKMDMGGAAAAIGTIYAIAKAKLPIHVISITPATDNRPGGNAITSGDVLNMYDGTTVEVLNTDAEGRLILADALAYAKKYKPELVIDMATLTGSAVRAIGTHATAAMPVKANKYMADLEAAAYKTYERIVVFPMWDDYAEQLKSKVADITNLGGPNAGQITAGKFLQHFTDYPYIHLDIAGSAFMDKAADYRPAGGTGVGVRMLFNFVKKHFLG